MTSAYRHFYACEACYKSEAFDLVEEALAPLRLKRKELKRLLARLTCPRCESRVTSGTLVVTPTPEQLRQIRLSEKFNALYNAQVRDFREFLVKYRQAFAELFREGLASADWSGRVVWVPNAIKYNPPDNPKVVKGWRDSWDEVPECSLKAEAYQRLKTFTKGLGGCATLK